MSKSTVGVVGAGAWGTALAVIANRMGCKVTLWSRNESLLPQIEEKRMNEVYLPGVFIDPAIKITASLGEVCASQLLILAVPSQSLRTQCIALSDLIEPQVPLVIASKGIERGSLALMSDIVQAILPYNPAAVLSGPNFASEAAAGLPTATTIACRDQSLADNIIYALGGRMFRPYSTDDMVGVQIGGALKNVIAIACGIALGKGYGENARAALITRGLNEMMRLATVRGGREETLMGLSGMGDLVLTCSSAKSRNMALGIELGKGKSLRDIMPGSSGLAEGITTADSVYDLSMKLGIAMPISVAVYQILKGQISVEEGIADLLERPFTTESRKRQPA